VRELQKLVMEKGPMGEYLDTSVLSPDILKMEEELRKNIIAQERAIHHVIKAYVPTTVGMQRANRPLGVFLFCGPTGVGKSELVKQFAKFKLGHTTSLTKIDCNEFGESHEVMKLLGAPPSYVGYNDEPRLSQNKINQYQTKDCKINIILFDEIEKADPRLFDAILSILGDGVLTLGNGKVTDFSNTYIFLTSNIGSQEVQKILAGDNIGLRSDQNDVADTDDKIYRFTKKAVERKFRPEFLNRVDSLVVFRSLSKESLDRILSIELRHLHTRIWRAPFRDWHVGAATPPPEPRTIQFTLTSAARAFVLQEGYSEKYGARELNRTIDRYLSFPIASLISSKQVKHGDRVQVDHLEGEDHLKFKIVGNIKPSGAPGTLIQ
jgi:ATP-dependent Clp protease ATP-binding subunit ClpA